MNKEQFSNSKPVNAVAATATITTDTTTYGAWIDTLYFRSLTIPLDLTVTTDGQVDSIGFQEANESDKSDAADCDDAVNLYYPDGFPIDASALVHVGCVSKKRYVRLKIVTSEFASGSIVIPKTAGLLQDSYVKPDIKESSVIADEDIISPGALADADTTAPKRA